VLCVYYMCDHSVGKCTCTVLCVYCVCDHSVGKCTCTVLCVYCVCDHSVGLILQTVHIAPPSTTCYHSPTATSYRCLISLYAYAPPSTTSYHYLLPHTVRITTVPSSLHLTTPSTTSFSPPFHPLPPPPGPMGTILSTAEHTLPRGASCGW
jgi:hypothetical protein